MNKVVEFIVKTAVFEGGVALKAELSPEQRAIRGVKPGGDAELKKAVECIVKTVVLKIAVEFIVKIGVFEKGRIISGKVEEIIVKKKCF